MRLHELQTPHAPDTLLHTPGALRRSDTLILSTRLRRSGFACWRSASRVGSIAKLQRHPLYRRNELYTPRSELYTSRSELYTSRSELYTPRRELYTPLHPLQ
ncbi:hypothetical protein NFI96_008577 [Prochilodus magdalenae]|nr:hypothetical protein NFI96_008577 [Prochilodus magdalenae]